MQNRNFKYIDDRALIRLVDSFVKINKAGVGNGEASLYLGSKKDPDIFRFFGCEDFDVHCIILRDELLSYMDEVKIEYLNNRFVYRNEVNERTWEENYKEIQSLPEEMNFSLTRKRQSDKNGRVYAQELSYRRRKNLSLETASKAYTYDLIRRIAIPEVSFIMLSKLENNDNLNMYASLIYDPNLE